MSEKNDSESETNKKFDKKQLTREESKSNALFFTYISSCEKYNVFSVVVAIIAIAIILFITLDECRTCFQKLGKDETAIYKQKQKKFWAYGKNIESGYLHNVFEILARFGYENDPENENWDLLWAHDYPFRTLYAKLKDLKPHQRVNHFPGSGYITNKVDLATSGLKYIPTAFKLPEHKTLLLKYVRQNPEKQFVQKDNNHRHIKIRNVSEINLDQNGTFIQEFVDKPLLVSGFKFDIGVYTIITSVDPLRVYIYNGDALLRFCPVEYYPFDSENLDKYVVADDYLPTWQIPDLQYYYKTLGFGMKESLNAYLRSKGENSDVIWEQIEDALRVVLLNKEPKIAEVTNRFKSKRNFFEMMRFDFVVDENLKIYLMEANMSPNLSSSHFPPNKLLFEQVIYNLLSLVGIGVRVNKDTLEMSEVETRMQSHDKNIAVYPTECTSELCKSSCVPIICSLCKNCLTKEDRLDLLKAHAEYINKVDTKRIFPFSVKRTDTQLPEDFDRYSPKNQMQYRWYLGKCLLNDAWCN